MASELFRVHKLTPDGLALAADIAEAFTMVEYVITASAGRESESRRCLAIARAKLEEACFFAKKAMAVAHSDGD